MAGLIPVVLVDSVPRFAPRPEFRLGKRHRFAEPRDVAGTAAQRIGRTDHERLVYRFQGRGMRLTDVFGRVRHELLA